MNLSVSFDYFHAEISDEVSPKDANAHDILIQFDMNLQLVSKTTLPYIKLGVSTGLPRYK